MNITLDWKTVLGMAQLRNTGDIRPSLHQVWIDFAGEKAVLVAIGGPFLGAYATDEPGQDIPPFAITPEAVDKIGTKYRGPINFLREDENCCSIRWGDGFFTWRAKDELCLPNWRSRIPVRPSETHLHANMALIKQFEAASKLLTGGKKGTDLAFQPAVDAKGDALLLVRMFNSPTSICPRFMGVVMPRSNVRTLDVPDWARVGGRA